MITITNNRWFITVAATITHLFLGTVYAWSFFQSPISKNYGWTQTETAWTFSISILMLGITAAWCGGKIEKFGVKKLAVTGTILYACGYIISYFALKYGLLYLLYLGFGVVGGIGLGMAYVTPVAAVSGWFPEKQGLVTGLVVMGFGLGAFVMSKIWAPLFLHLFNNQLEHVFLAIGITLLIIHPSIALFLRRSSPSGHKVDSLPINIIKKEIFTLEYVFIWIIFTFNIIAGMIFISFQSPLLQDILKSEGIQDTFTLEQKGATLIGISALFNGIGRFFWGGVSDKTGRIEAFRLLILLEIILFSVLIFTENPLVFSSGVCLVLLCYGGGFGILPSLIKEKYGSALMPPIYGITLIGWGIGGVVGPQITAYMKDHYEANAGLYSFYAALALITAGLLLSLFLKSTKHWNAK